MKSIKQIIIIFQNLLIFLTFYSSFKNVNAIFLDDDINIELYTNENNTENINKEIIYKIHKKPIKYWEENNRLALKEKINNLNDDIIKISSDYDNTKLFSFYQQLDDDEKKYYQFIYSYSIQSPPKFTVKVKLSNVNNIYEYIEILKESTERIFTALAYDNPELWWIGNYGLSISEGYAYKQYIVNFDLLPEGTSFASYSNSDFQKINYQIEIVKNDIMQQISNLNITTKYAIMKYIHDYLVTKVVYTLDEKRLHIRTLYGALVENKCVCEGYAEAFQYIAQQYGINCIIARSSEHEWNFVEMDNKWYVLDVTYDDPIIGNKNTPSGSYDNIHYNYFLTGTGHVFNHKKYSDDPDHKLVYSGYSDSIMVQYPEIESSDYKPSSFEFEETKLINMTNISDIDYTLIDDFDLYNSSNLSYKSSLFIIIISFVMISFIINI